jgi:glutaredoxin 3
MKKVEIYTTLICPYCVRAKKLLDNHNIKYEEIKISSSDDMTKMIERSNNRRTVPQIFIDDEHIGGYTELYEYFKNLK